MMSQISFDHPYIDWNNQDLYQEFSRFPNHVVSDRRAAQQTQQK